MGLTLSCGILFLVFASHSLMIFPQSVHRSSSLFPPPLDPEPEDPPEVDEAADMEVGVPFTAIWSRLWSWKLLPDVTEI